MNTTFSSGFYISMNEKKHTPAKAHSSHATLFQKYNHNKFSNKFYWWALLKNSAEIFHSLLKCSVNGKLKTAEHTLKIAMRTNNSVYYSKTVFGRFIAVFHGIRFWCAQQNSYAFTCNCSLFFRDFMYLSLSVCLYPFISVKVIFLVRSICAESCLLSEVNDEEITVARDKYVKYTRICKGKVCIQFYMRIGFFTLFYCWSHGFSLWPIKM